MWIAYVARSYHCDVDLPRSRVLSEDSMTISSSQSRANQSAFKQLPIASAWLPQCHPSPETACVKVHDDESWNQAIHDEAGNCREDMSIPSQLAGENGNEELAQHPLNGPSASFQT